jgi:glycosylphosphatidylinositol deacylase
MSFLLLTVHLFFAGNAGSFKQVRSLASVALRKAIDMTKYKTHFDFFTLDFGEEMSAIYGPVLDDQSNFAAKV